MTRHLTMRSTDFSSKVASSPVACSETCWRRRKIWKVPSGRGRIHRLLLFLAFFSGQKYLMASPVNPRPAPLAALRMIWKMRRSSCTLN